MNWNIISMGRTLGKLSIFLHCSLFHILLRMFRRLYRPFFHIPCLFRTWTMIALHYFHFLLIKVVLAHLTQLFVFSSLIHFFKLIKLIHSCERLFLYAFFPSLCTPEMSEVFVFLIKSINFLAISFFLILPRWPYVMFMVF